MDFLWFLFVGLIAGWLAGVIMHGGGYGIIGDIIIGIIGSFVGGFLFRLLGITTFSTLGAIIMAIIGAIIFISLLRILKHA
jgi:uncharacterized membrane protein YeaQ/YmgE (transglycosylase-associated protein family)